MEKKNLKILVIIVLSLVVLLIIASVKFNVLKKIGFKKFNQSNLNVVNTNNINPVQGEKYEKVLDGVSISFTKLDGWKYEELPATEEYKFALKFAQGCFYRFQKHPKPPVLCHFLARNLLRLKPAFANF